MKSFLIVLFICISGVAALNAQSGHLYLQTDKENYVAGETIWLKAYLISNSAPANASELFIDLYNSAGKLVDSIWLPVIDETSIGNLKLALSLPSGIYFLHGYCSNKILSPYLKKIFVLNPEVKDKLPTDERDLEFAVSVANLVAGIQNNIPFKISGVKNASEVNGTVYNSKKEALTRFKALYENYGAFELLPEKGESYFVQIDLNGTSKIFPLPQVEENGVSIHTGNSGKRKLFSIYIAGALRSNGNLSVEGQMDGVTVFQQIISSAKEVQTVLLPTDSLSNGPLRLIVKDQKGKSLGAKTIFINNPSRYLPLTLRTDTFNLNPGGYNVYSLVLPDSVWGNFSVAIADESQHYHSSHSSILSSSFHSASPSCFNFEQILKEQSTSNNSILDLLANFSRVDEGENEKMNKGFITITGRVFNNRTNKLITKGTLDVFMETKDSSLSFLSAPIKSDGSFTLENLVFYDTARFTYSLKEKTKDDIIVRLENENKQVQRSTPVLETCPEDAATFNNEVWKSNASMIYKNPVRPDSSANALKEVVVTARKLGTKEQVNKTYTSGLFRNSNTSRIVDLINEPPNSGGINILEYLQGRVAGLMISRTATGYDLKSNRKLSLLYEPPIRLYLDETETDASFLSIIQAKDVAMVKYFPPGNSPLPGTGIAGILAVYTKKPEDTNKDISNIKKSFVYEGYSNVKDFETENASRTNDFGATIYWKPDIFIDGSNSYRIKFKNSNTAKRLHVIVEGVTFDGRILHFEKVVE